MKFEPFGCSCSLPHNSICIRHLSLSASRKRKLRRRPVNFFCIGCHLRGSRKHTTSAYWLLLKDWQASSSAQLQLLRLGSDGSRSAEGLDKGSVVIVLRDITWLLQYISYIKTHSKSLWGKNALVSRGEGGYCVTIRQQILFTWNQVEWQIILTPFLLPSHRQLSLKNRTNLLMVSTDGQLKSFIFQLLFQRNRRRTQTHYTWHRFTKKVPWTWCAVRMEEI